MLSLRQITSEMLLGYYEHIFSFMQQYTEYYMITYLLRIELRVYVNMIYSSFYIIVYNIFMHRHMQENNRDLAKLKMGDVEPL